MNDGEKTAGDLRVRLDWTPEREAEVFRRLTRAQKRQATTRTAGMALGMFCLAAFAVGGLVAISRNRAANVVTAQGDDDDDDETVPAVPGEVTGAVPAGGPRERRLRFRDGSLAVLQSPETVLEVLSVEDKRIVNELRSGSARFEITKRPNRVFRVIGGDTSVEVLGTKFEVERLDRRLRVSVTEGRVRVAWPGGERRLGKDETGIFPPEVAPANAASVSPVATEVAAPLVEKDVVADAPTRKAFRKSHTVASRELGGREQRSGARAPARAAPVAEAPPAPPQSDASGAAVVVKPASAPHVEDKLSTMLRTADHARAGGRSLDAATALRAAAAENPGDPRVVLAEFRLGRLLLEDMGKPAEAATAFARVRALAPSGPLAPDALAREIEARAAAGDRATAHTLSLEYLAKYPTGSHAAWVRRWGALD